MQSPSLRRVYPMLLLISANLLWGSMWVVAKLTLTEFTPLQVSAWRMIVAGLIVAPWLFIQQKRAPLPARDWPSLIMLGLSAYVVAKFLSFWGLNLTTATNASLLTAIEPLFTIALARLILQEAIGPRRGVAFLVGAMGAWLLIARGWQLPDFSAAHVVGDLVFLLGTVVEAIYSVFGKALLSRHSASVVTMATIAASLLFWLPLASADGLWRGWPPVTMATVAAIGFLAIGCTVFAYWAWFHALQFMDAGLAALTIFIQPVWGALLAFLLLGEPMTAATLIGGGLVLTSLYLALAAAPSNTAPISGPPPV